ncbi:MAG: hypothetical protein IPG96_21495 [Proteobacteria bacterium]|nr:hypothetical protein [Pseudomonadota bacterium]
MAKRLLALSALSEELGEEPLVRFDLPQLRSLLGRVRRRRGVNSAPCSCCLAALGVRRGHRPPAALGGMLLLVAAA